MGREPTDPRPAIGSLGTPPTWTPECCEVCRRDLGHNLLAGRRHLVEFDQRGKERAVYGSELLKRLSGALQSRFGRGFSERNLE